MKQDPERKQGNKNASQRRPSGWQGESPERWVSEEKGREACLLPREGVHGLTFPSVVRVTFRSNDSRKRWFQKEKNFKLGLALPYLCKATCHVVNSRPRQTPDHFVNHPSANNCPLSVGPSHYPTMKSLGQKHCEV